MRTADEKRAAAAAYQRRYRAANPEKAKASRLKSYHKHSEKGKARCRAWYAANREKSAASRKAWYAAHPEGMRDHHLRKHYGMTILQWDALLAAQGFACAICGEDDPGGRGWHTDHNHKTGKVRGILCSYCNPALGMAGDNPSTLDLMAQYIRHHS